MYGSHVFNIWNWYFISWKLNFSFYSDIDKLFFSYNKEHTLKPVNNGTSFQNKNKIYVNYYLNNTNTIKIKVNITEKNRLISTENKLEVTSGVREGARHNTTLGDQGLQLLGFIMNELLGYTI